MRRSVLFALLAVGVAALAAQLLTVERVNPTPPVSLANGDKAAPAQVEALLTRACYDCHSNRTRWPWYSRIALCHGWSRAMWRWDVRNSTSRSGAHTIRKRESES